MNIPIFRSHKTLTTNLHLNSSSWQNKRFINHIYHLETVNIYRNTPTWHIIERVLCKRSVIYLETRVNKTCKARLTPLRHTRPRYLQNIVRGWALCVRAWISPFRIIFYASFYMSVFGMHKRVYVRNVYIHI